MIPEIENLEIYQGDSFESSWRLVGDDPTELFTLDSMTGKAQIRQQAGSPVLAEFTVALLDQGAVPGGFVITLTPTQTSALAVGNAVWDAEFANAGRTIVNTYMGGSVTIKAEVTKT